MPLTLQRELWWLFRVYRDKPHTVPQRGETYDGFVLTVEEWEVLVYIDQMYIVYLK